MESILSALSPVRRISPKDGTYQYFFGYYDIPAFSKEDQYHLCNRVKFLNHLPTAEDINEIGMLDVKSGEFTKLAETNAWNFQQGSLLQWNPLAPDKEIIYNVWDTGKYRSVIKNICTNKKRALDRALANVSPNGKFGLSINFSRVYDFRAGYGYCNQKDPWVNEAAPEEDGIFLVDMQTGSSRQIISYQRLSELFNTDEHLKSKKIVINHITFNQTSDRFLFLVRYFPDINDKASWKTGLGTSDLEGNIYLLREYTFASHYHWKDGKKILIFADCGDGDALYEIEDLSCSYKKFSLDFFPKDIHCSYSPDRRFILGDGYPDAEGYRNLYLYNTENDKGVLLGRFFSSPDCLSDFRCDLHARWNNQGTAISFDSTHEGFRGVYMMDLEKVIHNLL